MMRLEKPFEPFEIKTILTIEQARKNKLQLNWETYTPKLPIL
jgi:hypothetical protein